MVNGKVVVYTDGTFDLLHYNHLKMLEYARSLGDILIVAVNTDELVASYKSQPIVPFEERLLLIKALKYPDIVVPQHTLDLTETVKKMNIDIYVVGDDWAGKYDNLKEMGISVFYFPYGRGTSSSGLKQQIYDKYIKMKEAADSHFPRDVFDKK